MTEPIRILLADDHAVLRTGLRLLLDNQPSITVIGEVGSGGEAVAIARQHQPDIILLDLNMPGMDGLTAIPLLRKESPGSHILILTMHDDVTYLQEALRAGARGYILKKAVDSDLLTAIQTVMRGETYVHSAMSEKLLQKIDTQAVAAKAQSNPWDALSERERDVLKLAAAGMTNRGIGLQLSISDRTVQGHLASIYAKLGVSSRTEAVTKALQIGVIQLPGA